MIRKKKIREKRKLTKGGQWRGGVRVNKFTLGWGRQRKQIRIERGCYGLLRHATDTNVHISFHMAFAGAALKTPLMLITHGGCMYLLMDNEELPLRRFRLARLG
jgi:hypothetical protein